MFQASLRPSSGAPDRMFCIWFSSLDVLSGVLGSQEAGPVHCVEDVKRHQIEKMKSANYCVTGTGQYSGLQEVQSLLDPPRT